MVTVAKLKPSVVSKRVCPDANKNFANGCGNGLSYDRGGQCGADQLSGVKFEHFPAGSSTYQHAPHAALQLFAYVFHFYAVLMRNQNEEEGINTDNIYLCSQERLVCLWKTGHRKNIKR